jgi:hypothetical protein
MVQFNRNQQIQSIQDWLDELEFYPLAVQIAMKAFHPTQCATTP